MNVWVDQADAGENAPSPENTGRKNYEQTGSQVKLVTIKIALKQKGGYGT